MQRNQVSDFRAPLYFIMGKTAIELIKVEVNHILRWEQLPLHHKDPFDRLLIAQSQAENAILLSKDAIFSSYTVNVEW